MNTTDLFTAALGLSDPWYVTETELRDVENGKKELAPRCFVWVTA